MNILEKITNDWQRPWAITWFVCGALALFLGFWLTTERTGLDIFKLSVALVGLLCVLALAFRKNIGGNGLGMLANVGEIVAQGRSGATGLMMAPIFYFFTHLFGLLHWRKHQDDKGDMKPQSGSKLLWLITLGFIALGLLLFPWVNSKLQAFAFIPAGSSSAISWLGFNITWYQINVLAFVLGVTAQTMMILRYAASWWIWIVVNFVWLAVNLANNNMIFAIQTLIYQVNAFIALYEWWSSTTRHKQNLD
ncbi:MULTISPECIES: nicotinamide riboside transporter PnuC [Gammaproteobacteria]|uniref:nicotinamide riboside transporter PnuC n=1 Tax=Gammaproteobacteria TaxID=1236 RepID=UPI001A9EDE2D|nr:MULTISPECIES: nicotinamide riboside transporter PnuC [Gammaproteobacteria]